MAKRNSHSLTKLQKELKRKKKANEKLDRRQGKKDQGTNELEQGKYSDRWTPYTLYV
jgi:cell division protein FtsB